MQMYPGGNYVFSIPCELKFAEMTPTSAKTTFSDSEIFAPCLAGEACTFPLDWVFGLMRAISRLCRAVEVHDFGMVPIAVFEIRKDSDACHATVRTKASALAVRFLTIFLRDFEGWNQLADYPRELPGGAISYSGIARHLPLKTGKNVCSAALPAILKAAAASVGAAETRFWWTLVDRMEKMIVVATLAEIRGSFHRAAAAPSSWEGCVLTALRREELRILQSSDELVRWVQAREITERPVGSNKRHVKAMLAAPEEPNSPTRITETNMFECVSKAKGESIPPLEDHVRLRSCNFPPRKRPACSTIHWDGKVPCLSGIVFGPSIGAEQQICAPRGMRVCASTDRFASIW